MPIDVRFIEQGELPRLREVLSTAFGSGESDPTWDTTWAKVFEHDRLFAAEESGQMVGVGGSYSFTMTVPGAEIPAAGLTVVGVLPTHRRKGILNELMRFQLEDARTHDEPVSILWASEEVIYQRFGYGLATNTLRIQMDRGHGSFRNDPGPSGRMRLLNEDEALKVFPDVYERVRRNTPAMLVRDADWWQWHRLFDPKSDRDGASPYFRAVWEKDGQAEGYVLYRVKEGWDSLTGLPEGSVMVFETMSTSGEAHREIWRFIFGIDLAKTVTAYFMPVDDPLPIMVLKPRHLRMRISDGIWLRVVDVKKALEGRRYAADATVTFQLTDSFCPPNEGLWTLTADQGGADVSHTTAAADLSLDACDLGAAYLGTITFNQLARAGRAIELVEGAVDRADSLFRSPRAPWTPEIF
jgi:predicted acetyltransferase